MGLDIKTVHTQSPAQPNKTYYTWLQLAIPTSNVILATISQCDQ